MDDEALPPSKKNRSAVVYILGSYRSGTTLLGNVLGQDPRFTSVGEMRAFFRQWNDSTALCGCGKALRDCEVWTAVAVASLGSGNTDERAKELLREQTTLFARSHTWRKVPALLSRYRQGNARTAAMEYMTALEAGFSAVLKATGAEVVIDSSKEPGDAALLATSSVIDLRLIHIVRDPRGVVGSTLKASRTRSRTLRLAKCIYWSAGWVAMNVACNSVRSARGKKGKSLLVYYEDLVADPQGVLTAVQDIAGQPRAKSLKLENETLQLEPSHTVDGNVRRMEAGNVRMEIDNSWRYTLTSPEAIAVGLICGPVVWFFNRKRSSASV